MGNRSKLLNKPFRAFTIYALIILVCSIPVYFFVVDYIWLNELDEHNQIIKERIEKRFDKIQIEEEELNTTLNVWNILQPGTKLTPVKLSGNKTDSIYTITKLNEYADNYEINRFRGLSSTISINNKPYQLTIETNVEETDETMLAIAIVTFLFFALLVCGFIFLNKRIAKSIWKPFRNTLHKLKTFDLTKDKALAFEKTDIEEFEELNQVLQKLVRENVSVYKQQQTFIENASHELQTPLAVLKSKMDLLFQNNDITNEQADLLNAIALPLSRISRINKNLLLLAKIENSQFSETTSYDLSSMLNENMELLTDYFEDRKLTINQKVNHPFSVSCNKFLLETLLNNLLTNAIRHTPINGLVTIALEGKTLVFRNSGTVALRKDNLFERFSVSSSDTTNSGLGLAIVKEICNRYQWKITYAFENNFHSFSVAF